MAQPVDRYSWQQAICGEQGPQNPIARLVLLIISLHMNAEGVNAWPSQETIARRALVSRRSVVKHLKIAERIGWVARHPAGFHKQGWRRDGYEAVVPDAVYNTIPERPWEADPQWRRGERGSPPSAPQIAAGGKRGEPDASNVVNLATKRGAPGAH